MAERPPQPIDVNDDQSEANVGWHSPATPGAWHTPQEGKKPAAGWRVPAIPTTLEPEPKVEGAWHVPAPEDTMFRPEDIIEVTGVEERPPEALDPIDALAEAVHTQSTSVGDGESATVAAVVQAPEDLMTLATQTADEVEAVEDEEDERDTFSFSELVALASLAEEGAKTGATATADEAQIDVSGLSPAERALLQPTEVIATGADLDEAITDAADYARKQLEALEADESDAPATFGALLQQPTAAEPAATAGQPDPGEYARRQLEMLEGDGVPEGATPAPQATAPLDPVAIELAGKFRDTEQQVRGLRAQYQAGQLTRDDLQARLRQLMVLDNNQAWWTMGVETDTWYKFDNGEWVAAIPPGLTTERITPAAAVSQTGISPSLEYLPTEQTSYPMGQTEYSAYPSTEEIRLDENNMPLPRQVDRVDPDLTVVGTGGINLGGLPPASQQATVVGRPLSDATIPAQPVQYEAYEGIEAPYADTEPPDYALAEEAPIYEDIAAKRRQQTTRLIIFTGIGLIALALIAGTVFVLLATSWYNGIVTQWDSQIVALQSYDPPFQTATILDARGNVIVALNSQDGGARIPVALTEISPEMILAVIAVENERFYEDPGWDIVAISRAFLQNLSAGEIASGASTITQQIAKNLVIQSTEVTAERKVHEVVVAGEIAKRYPKNEILRLYLNEIFFGNQSYGVEAAAQFYFDKSAADLNLAEAAMLAGVIQSPAAYDPLINRDAAFERMDFVLSRIAEVGCVQMEHAPYEGTPFCVPRADIYTAAGEYTGRMAVQIAQIEARNYTPRDSQIKYPHFVNLVQAQVEAIFGPGEMFRRGFVIKTTLVPELQDTAQDALVNQLAGLQFQGVTTGSVMVTNPGTGAILAMVGSPDFNNVEIDGQVNNALTWQQPGSAIKPIVYTAALEGVDKNANGTLDPSEYYTPATIMWDVPTVYPELNYAPVNFDRLFHGPVAVRYALGNSYNVPAVKAYAFIGNDKFRDTAGRMGLDFLPDAIFGLPTGVGATDVRLYDMMEAYGTLANQGRFVKLYAIDTITDTDGNAVQLPARDAPQQVVQPQIAYLMQSILSDDNARASQFGTNSLLTLPNYPRQDYVGVKTGTSNDARDLWTMGFTRTAVVGVWLGRPDNNPTTTNGSFAAVAPIWNTVMQRAVQGVQPQAFTNPGNVVLQQVCADTGTLPYDGCPAVRTELFFIQQPAPSGDQSFVQTVAVDTWTGLRANQNCPDNQSTSTFANISDPSAVTYLNSPAGAGYAQRLGLPLPLALAPTTECTMGMVIPTVRFTSPFDNQTVTGVVSITGQVSANQAEFNRYQLYYAPVLTPDAWVPIGTAITTQAPSANSVLGQWDTVTVPNGTYILRLEVIANNGGFVNKRVTININNIPPTSTPAPPTPIPTNIPPFTPLPFDTPIPAQVVPPDGGPTPTIAVPIG